MAPARHALPWCEATISSTLAPPKPLRGLAAGSVLPSWAANSACPMSILTGRGKERKSLSDVPIHLTGSNQLSISIPVYIFLYISASLTRRLIPVPQWVKEAVDSWTLGAGITAGPLLRSINKGGRIGGHGFTPKVIWAIVKANAKCCGLPSVAPHNLRRTCARLCHQAGGELEQIQFLLGHISIQTTEVPRVQAAFSRCG